MYKTEDIVSIEMLDQYFLINWHITGWCNYHCPYCINQEFNTSFTPEEQIYKIADKINDFINTSNINLPISLRLIGGEPTYYDLPKILDRIEKIDRITLVTNFSRSNDFFKEMYDYCFKRKIFFFLICSWHEENTNFIDKVAELTQWCRATKERRMNNYIVPQITLLATSDFSQETLNQYLEKGLEKIRISIIRDENQNHLRLTQEQLDLVYDWNAKYERKNKLSYIKKNKKDKGIKVTFKDGTHHIFVNATDFTNNIEDGGLCPDNFTCTSGTTNMVIMPNGDIIINKCDYWKDIIWGNILKDFHLPTSPLPCKINQNGEHKKCTLCSGVNLYRWYHEQI